MERTAPTDHPIHEFLSRRWSPRAFSERPVEPAQLRAILEAARWAPSCYNNQPWRFIVATRDETDAFARLLDCLVEFNQQWARSAAVLMMTVAQKHFSHSGELNAHAWHDVGLATQSLLVQATALGLYGHAMAGYDADKARRNLDIPDDYEPVAALALGHLGDPASLPDGLAEKETVPRVRKPLGEIVFAGHWNQTPGWL